MLPPAAVWRDIFSRAASRLVFEGLKLPSFEFLTRSSLTSPNRPFSMGWSVQRSTCDATGHTADDSAAQGSHRRSHLRSGQDD